MTPKALLDTDILSALLRQQPAVVSRAIQYLSVFPQYTFSLITRYEILRGLKAKDAKKQLMAFDAFCQSSEIVPVTEAIISRASDLCADLHQRGQLIGDADILIAATADDATLGSPSRAPGSPLRISGRLRVVPVVRESIPITARLWAITMGLARMAATLVLGLAPFALAAGSPGDGPAAMVYIPGGEFDMGSDEPLFRDAQPVHRVTVDGFWIDQTEITNAQFAEFVRATGYRTVAERVPRAEDYPGALPEMLFAGSVVFSPPEHKVPLDDHFRWWSYVRGANWRHPEGAGSSIEGRLDHPVVHIAYEDAGAYAKWASKRLPTEAEWERAARGGLNGKKFVWGDSFRPNGQAVANTFQGHFPDRNTGEDGYLATSPVKAFAPNGYGVYGVAGNVWEWTADWYRPDTHARQAEAGSVVRNPTGPAEEESFDPSEPGVRKRVHKGGSYLCTDQYCARYMPGARGKGAPDTGTNHLGFRCVMTPEAWERSRQARSPGSKMKGME